MQSPIDAVADTAMSVVDEVLEGLGGMITPTAQGDDYAEAAWQRKLRYQANRKKRGRNYKPYEFTKKRKTKNFLA